MHEYLDRRYAKALYEISEENGKTEEYLIDLDQIETIINQNADFKKLVLHPEICARRKKQIFREIFQKHVDEKLLSFILLLIDKERITDLKSMIEEFEKIHLERQNKVRAKVTTVVPLLGFERESLLKKLEDLCDKTVLLEEEIDPSIIGGVYVRIGNHIIDGTVKGKLEKMKEKVLKEE